jgi:nitroimidazol reductase NimA-like FMN-containing flavoprotein (pyridoxamine 5'-phosphate oxidase superfamily)
MVIHELSAADCHLVLKHATYGRLACARHDQPYIVPFSFTFDPGRQCLYSISAPGQKIEWMRANPKVCVEVDDVADRFNWVTVVIFGRFEEIYDSKVDQEDRRRATELLQQRESWWLPGLGKLLSKAESDTAVLYRVMIDRLSGRRTRRASH